MLFQTLRNREKEIAALPINLLPDVLDPQNIAKKLPFAACNNSLRRVALKTKSEYAAAGHPENV